MAIQLTLGNLILYYLGDNPNLSSIQSTNCAVLKLIKSGDQILKKFPKDTENPKDLQNFSSLWQMFGTWCYGYKTICGKFSDFKLVNKRLKKWTFRHFCNSLLRFSTYGILCCWKPMHQTLCSIHALCKLKIAVIIYFPAGVYRQSCLYLSSRLLCSCNLLAAVQLGLASIF